MSDVMSSPQKRILVITAHPGDADMMAGGSVARWCDEGHDVHSVIVTRGDKGHDAPGMTKKRVAKLREDEQRRAAEILGLSRVTFLDFEDGELAWAGRVLAESTTRLIRQERPDIVVTHDPFGGPPGYRVLQLHPDQRAVGTAVIDACCFRAPGRLYHPRHEAARLATHRVREVLLIMSDHADYAIDVDTSFERKVRAVHAHASQVARRPDVEAFLRGLASRAGAPFGMSLAEGFKRLLPS
jgi:LmbE family N-acetylglucosaminyl deacetylase